MLVCGFVELLTLASIIPFLIVITDYQKILTIGVLRNLFSFFNINSSGEILLATTLTFIFASIFTMIVRYQTFISMESFHQ